ncbi:hypothetical protein Tco_1366371 [Tanacetum coccineum]
MSDSEHSTVTYTSVSIPVEDDSDIGSPGVDGPPIMPEDPYAYIMAAYQVPPSPDYIPGPEEPQSPPPLDFVPEPMYPEYIPQEDEILPAEEQPLPAAASPTADSPGYVPESDPEEDDEDPEEDPADYPADRDDDDDDDEDEDEDAEDPYSVARGDLYGFVDMVDVPPRCSTSRELDYGITDAWDDLVGAIDEIAPTTLEGVNQRVTDLSTIVEQETTMLKMTDLN